MAVSSTVLRVSWTEPSPSFGAITRYDVIQRKDGVTTLAASVSGTTTSADIGSLLPATTYEYAVTAFTTDGTNSSFSAGMTAEAPPTVVATLVATVQSASSVQLDWTAPVPPNGVLTGYRVVIKRKQRALAGFTPVDVVLNTLAYTGGAAVLTATVTGLEAATNYTFAVLAQNSAGWSPERTVVAQTATGVSSAVAAPTVAVLTDTSVRVSWTKPDTPNGEIVRYEVYHVQPPGTQPPVFSGLPPANGTLSAVITGLKAGVQYYFSVVAVTSAGSSPGGIATSARTTDTSKDGLPVMVIAGMCIFIVLVVLGFAYEYRRRSKQGDMRVSGTDLNTRGLAVSPSQVQPTGALGGWHRTSGVNPWAGVDVATLQHHASTQPRSSRQPTDGDDVSTSSSGSEAAAVRPSNEAISFSRIVSETAPPPESAHTRAPAAIGAARRTMPTLPRASIDVSDTESDDSMI